MALSLFRLWMLDLPMLLGLASCTDDDPVDTNPLAVQVSGMWWTLIDTEGTLPENFSGQDYTRMGITAKVGSIVGNLGAAIYNVVSPDGDKGKPLSGIVELAKGGCNLAGIKTEASQDIEGFLLVYDSLGICRYL